MRCKRALFYETYSPGELSPPAKHFEKGAEQLGSSAVSPNGVAARPSGRSEPQGHFCMPLDRLSSSSHMATALSRALSSYSPLGHGHAVVPPVAQGRLEEGDVSRE